MREPLTKSMKNRLRTLAELAYERELSTALEQVEADFARWRAGRLDAFALSDRLHAFHKGPSRDLYQVYTFDKGHQLTVARALVRGILTDADAGAEVVELLAGELDFLRSDRDSDEADDSDEAEDSDAREDDDDDARELGNSGD